MMRQVQRTLIALCATAAFTDAAVAADQPPPATGGELVYFGTRGAGPGQGVFAARLDPRTGKLTALGLALQIDNPTWLANRPGTPLLYTTQEARVGGVIALRADLATGQLQEINKVSSEGSTPAFLSLDPASNTVLVANYGDAKIAALPIHADGSLGTAISMQANAGTGPVKGRQAGPHAHEIVLDPTGRFALVPDLGADKLFIYKFDRSTQTLTPADPAFESLPPGTGPRHLAFHPNGKLLYLVSELSAEVRAYRWDAGKLQLLQTLPLPAPGAAKSGAEIRISADGRFLYVSNRVEDVVVVYAVNAKTGMLREIQRIASQGKTPWGMTIDPTGRWVLVANELSNTVVEFKRDPRTGKLSPTDQTLSVPTPDAVTFVTP